MKTHRRDWNLPSSEGGKNRTEEENRAEVPNLPEATIQRGLASDLPAIAKEWVESF
jgi:hypothetical protein